MTTLTRPPTALGEPSGAGLGDVPQVRLCLVVLAVVGVVTALHVAHATPVDAVAVVAVLVALAATVLAARHTLAVAGTGWAWLTGFVVHSGGLLTFAGPDLVRLVLLLGVAGLAAAVVRTASS